MLWLRVLSLLKTEKWMWWEFVFCLLNKSVAKLEMEARLNKQPVLTILLRNINVSQTKLLINLPHCIVILKLQIMRILLTLRQICSLFPDYKFIPLLHYLHQERWHSKKMWQDEVTFVCHTNTTIWYQTHLLIKSISWLQKNETQL